LKDNELVGRVYAPTGRLHGEVQSIVCLAGTAEEQGNFRCDYVTKTKRSGGRTLVYLHNRLKRR
jgi:hypothetical protein